MKKDVLVFLVCVSLMLGACSGTASTVASEACIGSYDELAFGFPDVDGPAQPFVAPGNPWNAMASIPSSSGLLEVKLSRSLGSNQNQFWLGLVRQAEIYGEEDLAKYQYFTYDVSSSLWTAIPAVINDRLLVDQLFVLSDGTIYGRNVWPTLDSTTQVPLLSKYDDQEGLFEPVRETNVIPDGLGNQGSISWAKILLTPDDVFWIFSPDMSIYRYTPDTGSVSKLPGYPSQVEISDLMISPGGAIVILNSEGSLFEFDPTTTQMDPIDLPGGLWPTPNSILMTKSDQLWLGPHGFRDSEGKWHLVNPRPLSYWWNFVVLDNWRYYSTPEIVNETSDGRLWFSTYRSSNWENLKSGTAWFDPNTLEGCWVTSEGSKVVEDSDGILWMAVSGTLYASPVDLR